MPMPAQKPHRSKQDYQTPPEFLAAVKQWLGVEEFALDLAASEYNAVCPRWFDERQNALVQPWASEGWAWLNPPFAHLEPWVRRAYEQSRCGASLVMLVPAGVGSNWWRDWVHRRARVLFLNGRLTFVGESTCYPKDCCLLIYTPTEVPKYDVWTWRIP
jgi:phage N-6-adenine-methyltransferase